MIINMTLLTSTSKKRTSGFRDIELLNFEADIQSENNKFNPKTTTVSFSSEANSSDSAEVPCANGELLRDGAATSRILLHLPADARTRPFDAAVQLETLPIRTRIEIRSHRLFHYS